MGKNLKNFRVAYFIALIFVISISFSGCAWIPFWDDDDEDVELESEFEEFEEVEAEPAEMENLKADLQTLRSQQEESQVKLEELEDTVSSLAPRVSEIEEMKGGGSGEGAANSAEIEELKDTIHKLQSQIEDLKDNINEIEFEAKLRTSPPPPRRVARGTSRGGAKSGYDKALRLFNIKQYKESLRLFKSLDNRRTPPNYRDNVVFWIGQCYFMIEDYERAIEKFNVVIDEYGSGNKVIDSMYTIGVAYNALGEKSKALDYLEQALDNGPSAGLRRKIKTKIREIEG